jgi:hypothetical protein
MDAALASNREMHPAAMKLGIVDVRRKTLWQLVFRFRPILDAFTQRDGEISITSPSVFQSDLTQLQGSLTLGGSYKDIHIDANSLVGDNREWLRIRVDAFCGAFFD